MDYLFWGAGALFYFAIGLGIGMHLYRDELDDPKNRGPLLGGMIFWPILIAGALVAMLIGKIDK